MTVETELQVASQLADAELGVAEELGWPLAIFVFLSAHLAWSSWFISVPAAAVSYYLATVKYRRRSEAAEDMYFRAGRLGKYVQSGDA